jgi:peroxiredoxin
MRRWRGFIGMVLWGAMVLTAHAAAAPALTPWTGGATPTFAARDLQGRNHDLGAYRGQVVLINFWATWCEPCRQEMPSMNRLRDRLSGKPFTVLAVNVDEPEARIRQFLRQTGLDLAVVLDPGKTVTRNWGVRYLPVSFVVGPDGRVRYRVVGDIDWDSDAVTGAISQLLSGG